MEPSQTLLDLSEENRKLKEQVAQLKESNGDLNITILTLKARIKELLEELGDAHNFFS